MANNRILRASDDIQRVLSTLLRSVKDPRISQGMLSVTRVDVTGDLRYAKVYISAFGLPPLSDTAEIDEVSDTTDTDEASDAAKTDEAHGVTVADRQSDKAINIKELKKGLKSASGWLRRELARSLSLRYTPELIFEIDNSIDTGAKINRLIADLEGQKNYDT